MDVSLHPIASDARSVLHNLYSYYLYDMSEIMGRSPEPSGRYTFDHKSLNKYWQDRGHWPYFIHLGDQLAGFLSSGNIQPIDNGWMSISFLCCVNFAGKERA